MTNHDRPEVGLLDPADLVAWCASLNRSFFLAQDPAESAEVRRGGLDFSRTLAGYAGDRVVATFRSFPTPLTVPGGLTVTADAVTAVTVSATHRRQGLLNAMMRTDLDAARERGEPVAILIASEWPIYGRYGFGPATEHAAYRIRTGSLRFLDGGAGTVHYVDADEARAEAPAVYEAHRVASVGEIGRTDRVWDVTFGQLSAPWADHSKNVYVLCRDDGGRATGYATYRIDDSWDGRLPDTTMEVSELIAATPAAATRLWRFVCEIDLVRKVKAANRSAAEPLRWQLADGRALDETERADFTWVRVLDAEAALAARRYLTAGRVVLEVHDPMGYAQGRFALDGGPDGAQCRRTDAPACLELDVQALGSAYLGGVPLRELATAGRVTEHRPGALACADAMFRAPVTPWSATWF